MSFSLVFYHPNPGVDWSGWQGGETLKIKIIEYYTEYCVVYVQTLRMNSCWSFMVDNLFRTIDDCNNIILFYLKHEKHAIIILYYRY